VSAERVAHALGAECRCGAWWRCRCPVHASQGATLALRDGERGLIVKCWAGCQPRDLLAELRRRDLLKADDAGDTTKPPDPAEERRRREAEAADRQRRISLADDMWRSAIRARDARRALFAVPRDRHPLATVNPLYRNAYLIRQAWAFG
jgi:hypothetical protein